MCRRGREVVCRSLLSHCPVYLAAFGGPPPQEARRVSQGMFARWRLWDGEVVHTVSSLLSAAAAVYVVTGAAAGRWWMRWRRAARRCVARWVQAESLLERGCLQAQRRCEEVALADCCFRRHCWPFLECGRWRAGGGQTRSHADMQSTGCSR